MSVIQEVSLLMSAMVRACSTKKSTYKEQVEKYNLTSLERKELANLLRYLT